MRLFILLWSLTIALSSQAQFITPYEKSKGMASTTFEEMQQFYQQLDVQYNTIHQISLGETQGGSPLQAVLYSNDGDFDFQHWQQQQRTIILINNGIHPGEPDGIDASMMLLRDLVLGKIKMNKQIVLAVISCFNVDGMRNRNTAGRANQNGPLAYGFRGNAINLDLNRDFIKMDALETTNLVAFFHQLDPDIFIDNHVSNGADYQHVMTLLCPQYDKMGKYLGGYLKNKMEPAIYSSMKSKGFHLVPYVNHWGHTPDKGWPQFYEPPRFASGFANLFQTFAFVSETHMLKPYEQRVQATYELMKTMIDFAGKNSKGIKQARAEERKAVAIATEMIIDWKVDTSKFSRIYFQGYEGKYKPSEVSGQPRLYYDKSQPYEKMIPFYNYYKPSNFITTPKYYVLPQAWRSVIERMQMNGVLFKKLDKDTSVKVGVYRIINYETAKRPYESHYLHSQVKVQYSFEERKFLAGDLIIPVEQKAKRYIIETLEPTAPDAFFAWNFFDGILQQKEGYSDYVFEDEAAAMLHQDTKLKTIFEQKKKTDSAFAHDAQAQLNFLYQKSKHFESSFNRYPVYRIDE